MNINQRTRIRPGKGIWQGRSPPSGSQGRQARPRLAPKM